ncbi:MAG: alpha/beta fold hydrolase, partial [Anaerolineaceae bacterium]
VLTFDYRNFGESDGEPRQVVDIKKQQADLKAAVAWARIHPDINPDKIILWGSSLGGAHVVTQAAEDHRIAAVVAQNPHNGLPKRADRPAEQARELVMATSRDRMRGWLGRQPFYIPITGTPDTLSVMANEEANEVMERMTSKTWRNEVAPRVLSQLAKYKPGRRAADLKIPLLVCAGKNDQETPLEMARELADKAPMGQLKTYPFGHFDFYKIAHRQKIVDDQVKFLRTHVPV